MEENVATQTQPLVPGGKADGWLNTSRTFPALAQIQIVIAIET